MTRDASLRLLDWLCLWLVQMWVVLRCPRIWRRVLRRNRGQGLWRPNVARPLNANEKYAWRKVFDHDPRFVLLSDKQAVKEWVGRLALPIQMPRTLWCGTDARDMPAEVLEGDVVVKATHGWCMNLFARDRKEPLEIWLDRANAFMSASHGHRDQEWAYFHVPRRLLAEEVIRPATGCLIDLKLYTFGTHVEQIVLISNRGSERVGAIWEPDPQGHFVRLDIKTAVSEEIDSHPLPDCIGEAIRLASHIGADFDHLRVDFMTDGACLYLGEITVYNLGGHAHWTGDVSDTPLNRSWDLRRSWFLRSPQTGWRQLYASALRRAIERESVTMKGYDGAHAPPLSKEGHSGGMGRA